MQKIELDELNLLKFENFTLKQKLLETQMSELQQQQNTLVCQHYPEFNGTHQCAVNFKDKILTIFETQEEVKNGNLDRG